MTKKEHLEQIARICREIGDDLTHIERLVADLEAMYGIQISDCYIQGGCQIQMYAGIELLEQALSKVAVETKLTEFGNVYKTFLERNVKWFQPAHTAYTKYLEANHKGDAVIDLRDGGANE